ncbi:MAG TPA: 2Fe-2S iron-sulfur cluster-binding protein [Telluria sp.]|jgi:ferredoxin
MARVKVFQVDLPAQGWRFENAEGSSVLSAAEAAGITLPSSCRNGTCRTCLCQLSGGSVRYLVAWPGLSAEEKAAGWILPCVAVPLEDLQLRETAARRLPR